jgi:hypothetical protein
MSMLLFQGMFAIAASPPDVRKVSDFPKTSTHNLRGYAPLLNSGNRPRSLR